MIDLSGFRPFSLRAFDSALTPGIHGPEQLIVACQIKHLGFVDGHPSSEGARALAAWLLAHRETIDAVPRAGGHVLNSGSTIERILAGDIVPEEAFAAEVARMTEGAVLPEMFERAAPAYETPDADGVTPPCPQADGKAPEAEAVIPCSLPCPAPSSHQALPEMGGLGGALPPGRLFVPIADSRFGEGFVLTGCGIALNLDESTAAAMRAAIDAGLDHLRARRGATVAKAGDNLRQVAA
jgi:hypothetical protein